jgi:hypothetical protein
VRTVPISGQLVASLRAWRLRSKFKKPDDLVFPNSRGEHIGHDNFIKRKFLPTDTGSTGIVVSAAAIPNVDRLPSRGPGALTYTSSGRIEQGDWVVVRATITGANGASVCALGRSILTLSAAISASSPSTTTWPVLP